MGVLVLLGELAVAEPLFATVKAVPHLHFRWDCECPELCVCVRVRACVCACNNTHDTLLCVCNMRHCTPINAHCMYLYLTPCLTSSTVYSLTSGWRQSRKGCQGEGQGSVTVCEGRSAVSSGTHTQTSQDEDHQPRQSGRHCCRV